MAASAATRILREHRLTWPNVVGASPATPPGGDAVEPDEDWREEAMACARSVILTDWGRKFVASLLGFALPSAKQPRVLRRLRARVRAVGAAP